MDRLNWYVLHCKPRKELQVCKQLEVRAINVYYPYITVKPKNPRSSTIRSYFPGYIFFQADLETIDATLINWLPGVLRLVRFGDYAPSVNDDFIQLLQQTISQIPVTGDLRGIKKGDSVRIIDGPLAGYKGIFDHSLSGKERALILLDMLGKQSRVQIDIISIEKAN